MSIFDHDDFEALIAKSDEIDVELDESSDRLGLLRIDQASASHRVETDSKSPTVAERHAAELAILSNAERLLRLKIRELQLSHELEHHRSNARSFQR